MTQAFTHQPDVQPRQVGQLLLAKGIVSPEQVEQAVARQNEHGSRRLLGEVLIELGFATEEQVTATLAEAYGVPFTNPTPRITDPRIVELLPRPFLEKHNVLPMFQVNGTLTVAVPEPSNLFLVEEIERLAESRVQLVAATAGDIRKTLDAHLPNANVFVIDDMVEDIWDDDLSVVEKQTADLTNLEEAAGRSPVIKLVNYLIYSAVQDGASDIHIEPDENRLRVRFRVDGRLFEKLSPPAAMRAAVASRIKIMADLDISERRVPQDGGIHVMLAGRPIDLRISTMPGRFGEKVVIRIIDNANISVSLDKLGFDPAMLADLRHALAHPNGIVLVTGPTGSGKSTTLYSMLSELNDDEVNISTVEDPVEYNLTGINQFPTNDKAGFTFPRALRSLLRQDPDVIMIGEVRDLDTARLATQAALTGHQVLSTLHTNDAPGAVTRLINIGVEPFLIAASLRAVLAQRLVRKVCPSCKEPAEPTAPQRRAVEAEVGPIDTLFRGAGCSRCRNTGYKGRLGLFELFIPDDATLDLISRSATLQEIRRAATDNGFTSLRRDGMEKVKAGLTTIEEVLHATAA